VKPTRLPRSAARRRKGDRRERAAPRTHRGSRYSSGSSRGYVKTYPPHSAPSCEFTGMVWPIQSPECPHLSHQPGARGPGHDEAQRFRDPRSGLRERIAVGMAAPNGRHGRIQWPDSSGWSTTRYVFTAPEPQAALRAHSRMAWRSAACRVSPLARARLEQSPDLGGEPHRPRRSPT
jgi:hypothetical protein